MSMLYVKESQNSVEQVGQRLEQTVKAQKFGVIAVIDLQGKMRERGVEFARACRIYQVCNPQRAKQVLTGHERFHRVALPHLGVRGCRQSEGRDVAADGTAAALWRRCP